MEEYLGILLLLGVALFIGGTILVLHHLLGPKPKKTVAKLKPYECGVEPFEGPQGRFSVKFYIAAMLFVAFDVEIVFLYVWAVLFRELGWFGFIEMAVFLTVLAGGLVYAWRKGVLKWT